MKKVFQTSICQVEIIVTEGGTIVFALDGKSTNPDRHATGLTADDARAIAAALNAAAEFSY